MCTMIKSSTYQYEKQYVFSSNSFLSRLFLTFHKCLQNPIFQSISIYLFSLNMYVTTALHVRHRLKYNSYSKYISFD